jgi:PAS domain S-box-containing protein
MSELTSTLTNRFDDLSGQFSLALGAIPEYSRIPAALLQQIAAEDLRLVGAVIAERDPQPFVASVQTRLDERLRQGFDLHSMAKAVDGLEAVVWSLAMDLDEARLLWSAFSQVRSMILQALGDLPQTPRFHAGEGQESMFRSLAAFAADGVAILDLDGRITYANRACYHLLGADFETDDLSGTRVPNFWPKDELNQMRQIMLKALTAEWRGDARIVRSDGIEFEAELAVFPVYDQDGRTTNLGVILRDVSERRKAERALAFRVGFERLIIEISSQFVNIRPAEIDGAIRDSLEKLGGFVGADRGYLFMFSNDGQVMSNTHEWCGEGIEAHIDRLQDVPSSVFPYLMEMLNAGQTFNVARVKDLPDQANAEREEFELEGIQSLLVSPVNFQGQLAGFMGFDAVGAERAWDEDVALLLRTAGETFLSAYNLALLQSQSEQILERRGFQVRVGTRIAQEIAAAPELGALFHTVVKLVKEQFGYYHTQILRYEPGLDAVALVVGYGEVGEKMLSAGHKLKMGIGLIGTAAATGETVLRPDLSADPEWLPNPLLPGTRGEISVPIKLGERVLGVLDVQSDRAGALSQDDQLLLEGLCGQIAVAMETTSLRQEMSDRLEELSSLYRATSREGWRLYREQASLPAGFVYDAGGVIPLEGGLDQAGRSSAALNPAQADRPGLEVALSVRGEVIGTLGILDDAERPLTEQERRLIDEFSLQLSESLESARLFEQTQSALAETQSLYTGSARVVKSETIDDVLKALIETTVLSQLDRAYINFFDVAWGAEQPENVIVAAAWSKGAGLGVEPVGSSFRLAGNPAFSFLKPEGPTVIRDVQEMQMPVIGVTGAGKEVLGEGFAERAGDQNLRGIIMVPLRVASDWFGVLIGHSIQPMTIGDEDLRQIRNLVDQAATVVQGLRLQTEMKEQVRELTALQAMMSRDAWVAYQSQMSSEQRGYLYDSAHLQPLPLDWTVAGGHASGKGGNGKQPSRLLESISTEQPAYLAPLSVRGEKIGVLGVQREAGRVLSDEDEAFLQAISEQVSQALERARLIEQTQKAAVEMQTVTEVGAASATILDPNELLQTITDLTKHSFGLYHAHIYLLDDSGRSLVLSAGADEVGRSMVREGWSIPLDEPFSIVCRAARERKAIVVADVRIEQNYLQNPSLPDTLSEMAIPLVVGSNLLGIFDVQANTLSRFSEEDLRIYGTLAAQVAVALQNARLYSEQLTTVERLRELDSMKSAFMANMSHELRTPLNSILGFTQVIVEGLDGPLTELMVSDLELIEKNGKHLLNLINDILDMAKIEAGRLNLSLEPINLYDLLDDVMMTGSPMARDKNLYIQMDADPSDDWTVMADHVRMRQIMINLLGNALKFTEQGGITLELERIQPASENERERVQVRFRDTGIGIPPTKLEEIFEAFSQVDNSTTRKAGGTGLGLPISRRLVEMHGGRLWAESSGVTGQGSVMFLELPLGPIEY